MGAVIGIIIYAIIAYITCPRKENGSFEEGAVVMYIIVPVVVLAIYLICNNWYFIENGILHEEYICDLHITIIAITILY